MKRDDLVEIDGSTWRVTAIGTTHEGATYVHLVSLTKGAQQKNGFRPAQVCGWLRGNTLRSNP